MKIMKNKIRMLIDITMTILFIVLMGFYITGIKVHEILGTITFTLFIIHNILNIKWYKAIFKGKYNSQRIFHLIIDLLLFLSMIGMMISGIMISENVFAFLNIPYIEFVRTLHMVSTSWGFVFMAMHVGLHMEILLDKISKKVKNSIFKYVYYLILVILAGFGIYSFIEMKLWKDMFAIYYELKFAKYIIKKDNSKKQ